MTRKGSLLIVDIGTSTIKVTERDQEGVCSTRRIGATPFTPLNIVRTVERLWRESGHDLIGISCLRRALVVNDDLLILASASDGQLYMDPAGLPDGCMLREPLAPVHRWKRYQSMPFCTLDAWLAKRLSGRSAVSESMAWLTGLWDTDARDWNSEAIVRAGIQASALPEVMMTFQNVQGVVLPFIGDHEATAAGALARFGSLEVLEFGTAMAALIGNDRLLPALVGLFSPRTAGYEELIDPWFSVRISTGRGPGLPWCRKTEPTPSDVLEAAVQSSSTDARFVICGGNAETATAIVGDVSSLMEYTRVDDLTPGAGLYALASFYLDGGNLGN